MICIERIQLPREADPGGAAEPRFAELLAERGRSRPIDVDIDE
jgi:hypothetical protein